MLAVGICGDRAVVIKVQTNVLFEMHNQDALCTGLYFLLKKADLLYSITFIPCYQADYVSKHKMTTGKLCLPSHCICLYVYYKQKNKVFVSV